MLVLEITRAALSERAEFAKEDGNEKRFDDFMNSPPQ